jgi:hypothetical protein
MAVALSRNGCARILAPLRRAVAGTRRQLAVDCTLAWIQPDGWRKVAASVRVLERRGCFRVFVVGFRGSRWTAITRSAAPASESGRYKCHGVLAGNLSRERV